jgi:phosphatidylglycerol:prolipoprotein diacylglycerol transferase
MAYGSLRFVAEYFREPDAQLGFLALGMSMGQWLCVPMIVLGCLLWVRSNIKSSKSLVN